MADVKWIKMATNIFDNRKVKMIESMPDGYAIIVTWIKLLCLAGTINDSGMIYFTTEIPYTDQMLSTQFGISLPTIQLALRTFEQFGMIEVVDDMLHISNWEKYQNVEGMEKIREQTRNRVAKHREQQRLALKECNVTVTQCNATEEDKEEDKKENKNKNSVRENTLTIFRRLIPDHQIPDDVIEKLEVWIKYKTERKEPYKEQGMKSLLTQIETNVNKYGDRAVCNLIDECMANNWKGIIFDRLQKTSTVRKQGRLDWIDDI